MSYSNKKEEILRNERLKKQNLNSQSASEFNALEEQAYIDALNTAQTEDEFEEGCYGLGCFYSSTVFADPLPDRAAYFFYKSYLCGNTYAYKAFQKVVTENNIIVDTDNLEAWAKEKDII